MEIFYSKDIDGTFCKLGANESAHCIKVLRHRSGDEISVMDGNGSLMRCRIMDDSPKGVVAEIIGTEQGWGSHPYYLVLAVCPTKNMDRYEWFAEKACEIGADEIFPVIGKHSERKVFKPERIEKILVSAAKQSLKGSVPELAPAVSVGEFIAAVKNGDINSAASGERIAEKSVAEETEPLKLIAYCFENEEYPRTSIKSALDNYDGRDVIVMIGPEGDFSKEEAESAIEAGFVPVHLGTSRLRTETAAVTAAAAVYFRYME